MNTQPQLIKSVHCFHNSYAIMGR